MLRLYLKRHIPLPRGQKRRSEGEALLALWSELTPHLDELDDYGGGNYGVVDQVATLLSELEQKLSRNKIHASYRHEILDYVLPCIEIGNTSLWPTDPGGNLPFTEIWGMSDSWPEMLVS